MNCQTLRTLLDHGDMGSLSDLDRRALEAHIETCADCAAAWDVQSRFQAMLVPPLPVGLEDRCLARMAGTSGSPTTRRRVGPVVLGCLVVGVAAAVLVGSDWLSSGDDPVAAGGAGSLLVPPGISSARPGADGGVATDAAYSAGTAGPATASPGVAVNAAGDTGLASGPSAGAGTFTVEFTRLVPVDATPQATQFGDWFHAALVTELRRVPNLVLIEVAEPREANLNESFALPRPDDAPQPIFDPDPANWPDAVDFRLAAGVGLQDNWIRLRHTIVEAPGQSGLGSKGQALPAGVTPGPEHAAALAAELVGELRVEVFPADAPALAAQFAAFDAVITDPSAGIEERIEALFAASQIVRRASDRAITARFVDSVLAFAERAEDAALNSSEVVARLATLPPDEQARLRAEFGTVRASVYRRLEDTGDPRVIGPLSSALLYDPREDVRLVATRILGEFADDAVARAALESAAGSDASAEVRAEARRYVVDDAARLDDIFSIVRNTSLSDAERLAPIMYVDQLQYIEEAFTLDTTTVDVIAELVERSDDVQTRRQVLFSLGLTESPSLVPIFIERLRNDPSPEVRGLMPIVLRAHRALPDVDLALELAASDDPAENVRTAAAGVLEPESP